ncbi:MAG TPA: YggS family pyridoxal phosphate-dependent enzyme [Trebonia sp.]|nr:YggS family pyridoxal phosphate-dependent enzyme [Trebonia sp.]
MSPTSSSDPGQGQGSGWHDVGPAGAGDARRGQLAASLAELQGRIAKACAAVGRASSEITLIAVTKTYPATDVAALRGLGVTDFGENRDHEAAPKAAALAGLDITWHFIGQLQTNKAGSVASYAHVVHSVDRIRLVRHLGAAARSTGRQLACLVQVSIDGDTERGGAPVPGVPAIAEAIEAEAGLVLGGVMAVAPLGMPPAAAFDVLRECSGTVRAIRPDAGIISAGMSGDLEEAVAAGATHLRIGTALLGDRKPPFL